MSLKYSKSMCSLDMFQFQFIMGKERKQGYQTKYTKQL